jgi:hypothetical protein
LDSASAAAVDRRLGRAHVETDGLHAEQPIEGRRQDVLAGVLLHVIEPPRPVDLAAHALAHGDRHARDVDDLAILAVDDLDDVGRAEPPHVERLPARRRIERRPIEHDVRTPVDLVTGDDRRVERSQRRIRVIQAFSHRAGSATPASSNPFARRRQLSQRPHGRPSGPGS